MSKLKITSLIVCSALLFSACSYKIDAPVASSNEVKATEKPVVIKAQPVKAQSTKTVVVDIANPQEVSTEQDSSYYMEEPTISGKIVGDYGSGGLIRNKIRGILNDYKLLMNDVSNIENEIKRKNTYIAKSTSDYVSLVAGMTVRLQTGTTPGNPKLVSQWTQAQAELEDLSKNLVDLNALANDIDNDSSLAAFLVNAIQATYGISGAVEEEHEELKRIEDELTYVINRIGRLVTEVYDDIERQNSYLEEERRNMQSLALAVKRGEFFGNSLMNRTLQIKDQFESQQSAYEMKKMSISSKFPVITIRFAEDDVDYAKTLYKAVDGSIDLKPNAKFRVVSVAPKAASMMASEVASDYAKTKGEEVFRDMIGMGVPASNITVENIVSEDVEVAEVQVFLK